MTVYQRLTHIADFAGVAYQLPVPFANSCPLLLAHLRVSVSMRFCQVWTYVISDSRHISCYLAVASQLLQSSARRRSAREDCSRYDDIAIITPRSLAYVYIVTLYNIITLHRYPFAIISHETSFVLI